MLRVTATPLEIGPPMQVAADSDAARVAPWHAWTKMMGDPRAAPPEPRWSPSLALLVLGLAW